jgi:flagellar protein FlaG
MPIDNIAQVSGAQVKPPSPGPAVPRQQSSGDGQPVPPVAGTPPVAEVKEAVSRLNQYVQTLRRDLEFRVDEGTNTVVVTVVDPSTKEVIRQIPSEEVLAVAKSLEQTQGVILNTKA